MSMVAHASRMAKLSRFRIVRDLFRHDALDFPEQRDFITNDALDRLSTAVQRWTTPSLAQPEPRQQVSRPLVCMLVTVHFHLTRGEYTNQNGWSNLTPSKRH